MALSFNKPLKISFAIVKSIFFGISGHFNLVLSSHVAYVLSTKPALHFCSFNNRLVRYCGKSINNLLHWSSLENIDNSVSCFRTGSGDRRAKKGPLPKICHTWWNLSHTICYNDETWYSYTLPKEDPKNIWITLHTPWVLLTSAFFYWKSSNFGVSRNTDIDCTLIHNFYFFKLFLSLYRLL